jgi:hypothetical protein
MNPGDIFYTNVSDSQLVVLVRRGDGQYFDFVAKDFATPSGQFDKARFCLPLTADAIMRRTRRTIVPAAASADPQAELIEAIIVPDGSVRETQSFWIGGDVGTTGANVPMSMARGAIVRFTG